ncbi:MAG: hypothetical protein JNM24_00330 [Bdellovibrionaceae bacterium]|nr:hypothetical protein [Pseudobdellovibrionaceae bacterium]
MPFKVQTSTEKKSESYTAQFSAKAKKSYQVIVFAKDELKGSCPEDTLPKDFKLETVAVGPGGAAFNLHFCAQNERFVLGNLNSMSNSDIDHGIELDKLAIEIQKLLSEVQH